MRMWLTEEEKQFIGDMCRSGMMQARVRIKFKEMFGREISRATVSHYQYYDKKMKWD